MKEILVRNIGDCVYYLSSGKFEYGKVISRTLESNNSISYRVKTSRDSDGYQGDFLYEKEIFSTKEELLEYCKQRIHEL